MPRPHQEHAGDEVDAGTDADRDDRLAESDQDDQPVPLGEVLRRNAPAAADADHRRPEVVDRESDHPHCDARVTLDESGRDEQ